jgi:hypothetical protein
MPDTNYPYVDLNGVFNVQKDYLAKVTSESSDPSTTGIINDIQTNKSE